MADSIHALMEQVTDELRSALRGINADEAAALREAVLGAERIFVAGKGRSGFMMRGFAMRLMHLGKRVYFVDDVVTPSIDEGDLLVIGSGSGRTASLLRYAERATSLNASLALVTIAPDSPIGQLADVIVQIPASTPKLDTPAGEQKPSVQPMGSLFEQALGIFLDSLIIQLLEPLGETSDSMFKRHANLE